MSFGREGTKATIEASATAPIRAMAQKAARQPNCWPRAVPNGTPMTFESVRPVIMSAMARERRSEATRLAAMIGPMPMKAPWQRAETTRPVMSTPYSGALAASTLPAMKRLMRMMSMVLRGRRVPAAVMIGAPMATEAA